MECQYCKKDVVLPFKCSYCGGYFCSEHRLPENHACPEYWKVLAPREEAPPPTITEMPERRPYEYSFTYTSPRPTSKIFWFSPKELKHLTLSALLVMGVGLSFALDPAVMKSLQVLGLGVWVSLAIVFTSIFLVHELAHKLMAQHYGLWAEFRLTMFGALLTLVSMLSPFFKIVSPGAVMIAGPTSKEIMGKTALAGPLTNIAFSLISVGVLISQQNLFPEIIVFLGAVFNAWIALFNLLPFGIFDGLKVFQWNKIVWAFAFITSVALTVFAFSYGQP